MRALVLLVIVGVAAAQFEAGHVKILQDQRYQDGAQFGNYRNQEDGIKYQEETDPFGVRRGYWEYPDETGRVLRVEFEAGPGIGFRVVNSNHLPPTPVDKTPVVPLHHQQPPIPVLRHPTTTTTTTPGPINLFDYAANLEFSRHAAGHNFKFTAV